MYIYLLYFRNALEIREREMEMSGMGNRRRLLQVKLPETEPEAFRMVLKYIYTDRIDPTEKGF